MAGGNKQRDYISKEDASSPTIATESVLLSCIVDAEEGRDVAVVDILNVFIQMRIKEEKDMAGDHQDSRSPSGHSFGDRSMAH